MAKIISFDELLNTIKLIQDKRILITFHSMGDRDAVGSAIAISKYLKNSIVATPDFITGNTKKVLEQINYRKIDSKFPNNIEYVVVVDANNTKVTGTFENKLNKFASNILFIDHHAMPEEKLGIIFNDEKYNSAASIIFEMLKKLNQQIDRESAILLLNGIISDSAEFQNADARTFSQISELLEIGKVNYAEVSDTFHNNVPAENRVELIEALKSANVETIGKYVFMSGKTKLHANLVADNAIKLGADASLFWDENPNEVSISARLRAPLDKKLSMHLGVIMQNASKHINGNGGGHPCAAGAYGPNKQGLNKFIEEVTKEFTKRMVRR